MVIGVVGVYLAALVLVLLGTSHEAVGGVPDVGGLTSFL